MTGVQLPCSLDRLLPHEPPMRWLDELVSYEPDRGEAVARIPADHLLADTSGALHRLAAIELIAQAAAAHEGYRRALEGRPVGGGFLAGVRDFSAVAAPRIGEVVTAVVRRTQSIGAMEFVHGHVECDGRRLAEGDLLFFLSDDLVPDELHGVAASPPASAAPAAGEGVLPALESSLCDLDREGRRAVYSFPRSFPAFSGHFPTLPILPAVVAVVCAAEMVAILETEPVGITFVKRAKFTRAIPPEAEVEVVCSPAEGEAPRLWRLQLSCGGERAAVVTLGEATPPSDSSTGGDGC